MCHHRALSEPFGFATSIGLWRPLNLIPNGLAFASYQLYTCFTFSIIILLMITQLIATVFFTKTVDDFTEATYMLLSTINASVKAITLLTRRRSVIELGNMLLKKECVPRNAEERKLCEYFDKLVRYCTLSCVILAEATVSSLAVWPMLFAPGENLLPLRAWHPFDTSSGLAYWISYLHQSIGLMMVAAYDVANDTIIAGYMIQTCGQLDLMMFRLQEMSRQISGTMVEKSVPRDVLRIFEKKIISQSVQHHLLIFRFAEDLNSIFAPSILIQFCLSSIVLCVTIYQLTANKTRGSELVFLLLYLLSMLVEFFIYCWFGNEVSLKSLELTTAICGMDWTTMHVNTIKELIIMMIRSTSPILLSCGPLITLSLDSFMNILKISYSAFNVLQKS